MTATATATATATSTSTTTAPGLGPAMHFRGIGTATPVWRYRKDECLAAFQQSDWFAKLDARAHFIARTVLQRDNGIDERHLAVASLEEVFCIDPDTLARRYAEHAPALAAAAARRALDAAGLAAADIDAVVVSTCTGYLCPGLSGHVVERLQLRRDVQAFDLVGQGCAAALPNLQLARALIGAGAGRHVLSVCVEVSSAAMYLDNDPGVLISACLFGDGAGAAVLSAVPGDCASAQHPAVNNREIAWHDSISITEPAHREALRFEQRGGMLRNILTRQVPALAAERAEEALRRVLERAGLTQQDIGAWILHAGGRDVLKAIERSFRLKPEDLRYSADVLRSHGNLSSAFVYFVLDAALADNAPGRWWWLSAFGAGFSCHGALLRVR